VNPQNFIGNKAKIIVSDPWEFETETGTGTLWAKILQIGDENSLLLQIENPIKYKNTVCEYFVASPRLANGAISDVQSDAGMFSSLALIPPNRAMSENPFDLSWWRGGITLIASVKIFIS
jgi:hypothetical protein